MHFFPRNGAIVKIRNGDFFSKERNIWGIFLVESSWAAQELSLVMAVETFTCINKLLPLKALPGAAGRTSWGLRREREVRATIWHRHGLKINQC